MISYNEAIYINKRKVTTYLMQVGGGLYSLVTTS